MLLKANIIIFVCYIINFHPYTVLGQVCVETKMVLRDVPETYLYTYMEAYERYDCLFWCTDKRVATATGMRIVQKSIPEQVNVCCEGYIEDESYNGDSIHCKPYCSHPCVNGYCKSPDVCLCNPGYMPDTDSNCLPLCMGCDHGKCIAPNICLCDTGYNLISGICEPVCTEPCLNGSCVAPETCQCLPGYKKSENDLCEPYCSSYTASGDCISTITCEPGWTKVTRGVNEICVPECLEPCINGVCLAPNSCECLNGYEKSVDGVCEPYCSECLHGSCVSPQKCVCDPGWYKKEWSGSCLAHCDHNCGNGTCIAPNVCACFPGYKVADQELMYGNEAALCIPICNECEGVCVAPGECVCESPQEAVLVNADGKPCDCITNCTDTASKCERTICLITTTAASVTEYNRDDIVGEMAVTNSDRDYTFDDVTGATDAEYDYNYNELKKKEQRGVKASFNWNWFYVLGSSFILCLILLAVTIKKRKYGKSLNRNIFKPHETEATTAVHYKQST